jgi:RimJ/RimL family protein N-acetyltransferase
VSEVGEAVIAALSRSDAGGTAPVLRCTVGRHVEDNPGNTLERSAAMGSVGDIEVICGNLAAFHAVALPQRESADTQRYLQDLMDAHLTQPDWCFTALRGGQPVGRVALWGDVKQARPTDIVLLDLPWHQPHREPGARLLERCATHVRSAGVGTLRHVLDEPPRRPQWQHDTPRRTRFLLDLGFAAQRSTRRFEWGGAWRGPSARRLAWRTAQQLGRPALAQVLQQVVAGSLDQVDQAQAAALGAPAHAQWLLGLLEQMDHQPSWWEVGHLGNQPVGLVLPTAGPGFGTIGYIGVLPAWRGQGHVDELLARGTTTLLEAGLTRLVSDTDVANAPMAAAFARLGWNEFARRTEYALAL